MKHRCPICGKATESASDREFPFCSPRCKLLDLGNWASEKYRIAEPRVDESAPDPRGGEAHGHEPVN